MSVIKDKTSIEDYLGLLFAENPTLEGSSVDTIVFELNKKFNLKTTYKQVSLIYEPILEFEPFLFYEEEEEDFI